MTREEAVQRLQGIDLLLDAAIRKTSRKRLSAGLRSLFIGGYNADREALGMAITSLQSSEYDPDLIEVLRE